MFSPLEATVDLFMKSKGAQVSDQILDIAMFYLNIPQDLPEMQSYNNIESIFSNL